jgi:DNA-binding MurR/RpiR family transcriptional regulator
MALRDDVRAAAEAGLSTAERRVAEAVLEDPARVAFGTVAELARRSGTSGPSVVRVARKLGYDGFRDLQAAAQAELTTAAARIRAAAAAQDDPLARALATEVGNVEATLRAVDPAQFTRAVRLLTERRKRILVLGGDAERGIAVTFADQLAQLRDGVELLDGPPPRVSARAALAGPADVVVAIDVGRYDAWLLDAVAALRTAGAAAVAVTDGPLSPLAAGAAAVFAVRAEGAGPFDSHVGTLALLDAVVAGVADRLRSTATDRLDRIEAAWTASGVLRGP